MQIGIHGYDPQDAALVADLGVQWTKYGASNIEDRDVGNIDRVVDGALAAGLNVVLDLRTAAEGLHNAVCEWRGDNLDDAVKAHIARVAEGAAWCVEQYGDRVHDWEFWGEFACPYVSQLGGAGWSDAYHHWLQQVHGAIKSVDGNARVWNGGYGTDADTKFVAAMVDNGAGDSFDACNLHHYLMSRLWPEAPDGRTRTDLTLDEQIEWTVGLYDTMFAELRAILCDHPKPFVSTEWGCPIARLTKAAEHFARVEGLTSHVFQGQIHAPFDDRSAALYRAWLDCFERNGMQVLIVHTLRDEGATKGPGGLHWGRFCGLRFRNDEPKGCWDVVREYAWRGRATPVDWGAPAWT